MCGMLHLFCFAKNTLPNTLTRSKAVVRIRLSGFILQLIATALAIGVSACNPKLPPDVVKLSGKTMGTLWQVSLGHENSEQAGFTDTHGANYQSLQAAITAELQRINALMSTWDSQSELSLFNANQSTEAIPIHPDTLEVIRTAQRVAAATDGAYDITRGNVFTLWGFSRENPQPTPPTSGELSSALAVSGWQKLNVSQSALQKSHPDLHIDLSSVAKGFAVDQIGKLLEAMGISHYLVNIGGEIRVRGRQGISAGWEIGVETPDAEIAEGLKLQDAHLATSGSYRNVRIIAGRRVSHIIDGRTGEPIEHALVAATVLHHSTMLADAWATAYMVLGADAAQQHSLTENLAVQLTLLGAGHRNTKKPASATGENVPEFSLWRSPAWLELESVKR